MKKKKGFYTKTDQLGIVFMVQLPRKNPNRIANENKRIALKTFAKDYGAKKDVFILFFLFAQIPSGYSKCNKSIRIFFYNDPHLKNFLVVANSCQNRFAKWFFAIKKKNNCFFIFILNCRFCANYFWRKCILISPQAKLLISIIH